MVILMLTPLDIYWNIITRKFTNRYPISNILKKTNIWSSEHGWGQEDIWISETKKKKKNGRIFGKKKIKKIKKKKKKKKTMSKYKLS